MADRTQELKENRPERRDVLLWIAVLAGPVAWVLTEQVSYMLAPTACTVGSALMLHLVPVGALGMAGAGAAIAWSRWRREPEGSSEKGDPPESRRRFMAMAGFWLCAAFALVILATALPPIILRVCD